MGGTAKLCAAVLICLVALVLLRQCKPEWAPMLRIAATVMFFGVILVLAAEVLSSVKDLCGDALPEGQWNLLVKALGLAFLTEMTSGICRDSGETSLATWVETAGKLEILLLTFPLLQNAVDWISQLVSGG